MLTDQRHQIILAEIEAKGQVASSDLAAMFDVSEDTIRRDLRHMAKAGVCRRVYGGAVAPYAGPVAVRHSHRSNEKQQLARTAVGLLRPGQTVLMDAGSTNAAIAAAIPDNLPLTVATNSMDVARALVARPAVTLIVMGGQLNRETGAFVGPAVADVARGIAADLVFLGSCGLDAARGITAFDPDDVGIKQTMTAASVRVVIAATLDKLGTSAAYRVAGSEVIDDLVLSATAKPEQVAPFENLGIHIHRG